MIPKKGPALVVVGIVAFITIGGGLLATLGQGPKVGTGQIASPPGLGLPADRAKTDLKPIVFDQQPPSDIQAALVVPAGSQVTAHSATAPDTLYDGSITLSVPAADTTTIAFYKYELAHDGWHISQVDAGTNGGTNIYAVQESNDGYLWEVGVLVEETNGAISPALAGGGTPAETSSVEIRLIEEDDED